MKRTVLVGGVMAVALSAGAAFGQVLTPVLREAEDLPGGLVGVGVSSISNAAGNGIGGWSWTVTTGSSRWIWGTVDGAAAPAPIRVMGTVGIYEQTGLEAWHGLSDTGSVSYSPTSTDTSQMPAVTGLDGIWLDDQVVLIEEQAAGCCPGFFWVFGSRPGMASALGEPYGIAGISATQGGSTQQRVLVYGNPPTSLLRTGDVVPGLAGTVGNNIDFDARVSASGTNWITQVNVGTGSVDSVVMNGAVKEIGGLPLTEGQPLPASIAAAAGETWTTFDYFGVTDAGDYMIAGRSSLGRFILVNDQMVLREGVDSVTLPGVGTFPLFSTIRHAAMNTVGDWAADWGIDDGSNQVDIILVNSVVVAQQGQAVDWNQDGVIDASDELTPGVTPTLSATAGLQSMAVSGPDASGTIRVMFRGTVDVNGTTSTSDDLDAAFVVEAQTASTGTPCPCDRNGDNFQTVADFFAFLNDFNAQLNLVTPQPGSADFDASGFVTPADFFAFLNGCLGAVSIPNNPCP